MAYQAVGNSFETDDRVLAVGTYSALRFTAKVNQMDAKVDGSYKMSFTDFTPPAKAIPSAESNLELTPHERIRYTDKFDDPNLPGEMTTTITLRKVSQGSSAFSSAPIPYKSHAHSNPDKPWSTDHVAHAK